jgi:Tol biopolymer transport system component
MPLDKGTRRGPYEILAPLGAGGMGEVYRARDTRLQRDVAIKSLPADFAADPERLSRFQREARLLASLNHPNIAAIYGLEETGGETWLVLEIVEGESLSQRLAAGPLPLEETLAVCAQIAAGVSAAHEAGMIHRDLKPGNVMIRHDGSVKVLDFGLAKGVERTGAVSDLTASPTISLGTQAGVILGTAAYMSPEQTRGRALDKRTDVWSFGCILYECLTGRQAFGEETVSDTLASIIRSEPDWNALPAQTPAKIRDLVKRCLQKDPRRRLHDIADAALEIDEALVSPKEAAPTTPAGPGSAKTRWAALAWIGLGLLVGTLAGMLLSRALTPRPVREHSTTIASVIPLPVETRLRVATVRPSMTFSPDGRRLVFRATLGGASQLYLRELGRANSIKITGTEGAFDPFFSPDGEWLAFFAGNELRKVALSGGAPTVLTDAPPVSMGGTWARDGTILFASRPNGGLALLPSGSKTYRLITTPDAARGERALLRPQMLPDGQNVLVIVRAGRDFDDLAASNAAVHSLQTGKRRVLVEGAGFAQYVEPGYLLFTKGTTLYAAPCDSRRWALTGPATPLIQNVLTATWDGLPYLAASDNGLLAYAPGGMVPSVPDTVAWVDRAGKEEPLALNGLRFAVPRLSPDGKRLALTSNPLDSQRNSISIYDFARGVLSNLTPEPGRHFASAWSPDGRRLAFSSFETGDPRLVWKASDASGELQPLSPGESAEFASSWSPDGRTLLSVAGPETMDLWLVSTDGKRERRAWLTGPAWEVAAFFSPDGRAVAYVSNESGRNEVYVRPYPGPGAKIKVSTEGGTEPAWSPAGREIFYRTVDSLMVAPIQTLPEISVGTARVLIPDPYERWSREDGGRNYDVSADGNRFVVIRSQPLKQEPITSLNLLANWPAELGGAESAKR